MALSITFVASGAGLTTFTTAGSALSANQRITGGIGSIDNNTLNLILSATQVPAVTAYVTGVSFTQTINGAPIYTDSNAGNYTFIYSSSQSYASPVKLTNTTGTIAFALTALGAACAKGVQTGTLNITLSTVALTGTDVRVAANPASTVSITVTAVNTPDASGLYTCESEVRRLWAIGYIG